MCTYHSHQECTISTMGPPEEQPAKINWKYVALQEVDDDDGSKNNGLKVPLLHVSNEALDVPKGLYVQPNFLSQGEALDILEEADKGESIWDGFEQRRRIQRWARTDPELPNSLQALSDHFEQTTGHKPLHISVEEYPKSQLQRHFNPSDKSIVTTFESPTLCGCSDEHSCSCFVAEIPIAADIIESINRPKQRRPDCWDLYSYDRHAAGLILQQGTLHIKTNEYLWQWRSRIASAAPLELGDRSNTNANTRVVLVKLSRLPSPSINPTTASSENHNGRSQDPSDSNFGYIPKPEDLLPRTEEMPPLEELLTIIVTTSPIKSNPSTELLERVFNTFFHGGDDFALKCQKVIVCDGCREKNESVSKRHSNSKQAMRNGIVNSEQLLNYTAFKKALRELCATAPSHSPFFTARVEELETRHGYGFALRHALQECVQTPFVIVIQHDRTFMRKCPIFETVRTMWHHRNIKYVGMSMRSNLLYRDMFLGKYGRSYVEAMTNCTLRPPELALDASLYGPDSASTQSMDYSGQEKLRENILALMETYRNSQQHSDHQEWMRTHELPPNSWQLSLTPTFFWYDNVHICETEHYRDFIFDPTYKMVVRGGFVEDKLSPVIKKTVERFGLAHGHARFGCYLLDDHSGMFFTGHLDGGAYCTKAEKDMLSSKKSK